MRNFRSLSEHNITGRGKVFVVVLDDELDLVGKIVHIDDKEYQVTGVESQGVVKKGSRVGLLVK